MPDNNISSATEKNKSLANKSKILDCKSEKKNSVNFVFKRLW